MKFSFRKHEKAMAEAIFGSAARGSNDHISDKDILIVDEDSNRLNSRRYILELQGWSVASYTFKKLQFLARSGCLFINHLKQESRILCDKDGRLSYLLYNFQPRFNYKKEIYSNYRLSTLAQIIPDSHQGFLFAADVLYVTVRNYGILALAEQGHHVYDFANILYRMEAINLIERGKAETLFKLRGLKKLYRNGNKYEKEIFVILNQIVSALPFNGFPKFILPESAINILELPASSNNASAYETLRDLEKRYIALTSLVGKDMLNEELRVLSSWIHDPRAYASLSTKLAPKIRHVLNATFESYINNSKGETTFKSDLKDLRPAAKTLG